MELRATPTRLFTPSLIDPDAMMDEEGFAELFTLHAGCAGLVMVRLRLCDGTADQICGLEQVEWDGEKPAPTDELVDYTPMAWGCAGRGTVGGVFTIEAAVFFGRVRTSIYDPAARDRIELGVTRLRELLFEEVEAELSGAAAALDMTEAQAIRHNFPAVEPLLDALLRVHAPEISPEIA